MLFGLADCPHCGAGLPGPPDYNDGDMAVCWLCCLPSVFGADGELRKPTPDEYAQLFIEFAQMLADLAYHPVKVRAAREARMKRAR